MHLGDHMYFGTVFAFLWIVVSQVYYRWLNSSVYGGSGRIFSGRIVLMFLGIWVAESMFCHFWGVGSSMLFCFGATIVSVVLGFVLRPLLFSVRSVV